MTTPKKTKGELLAAICSALEYLVERGEVEKITEVLTKCRYIHPAPKLDSFAVKCGRQVFIITAMEL